MSQLQRTAPVSSTFTLPIVLWLVVCALAIAVFAEHSALVQLCALLLCTVGGAKAWSRFSLTRVQGEVQLGRTQLFPGESLKLRVRVDNAKRLPVWLKVELPLSEALIWERPLNAALKGGTLQRDSGLSSHERATFDWTLIAARRGVHTLGPLQLSAGDPLGFFMERVHTVQREVIVYPRLLPLSPLLVPRADFFGKPGSHLPIEDPTYVHGLRDYQSGRSARNIHWKASARHDRLLEKLCDATDQARVLLIVRADDFVRHAALDAFERCLEVAASLAVELQRERCPIGLWTNARLLGAVDSTVQVSRHPGQVSLILERLARATPEATGSLLDLLTDSTGLSSTTTAICLGYGRDETHDKLRSHLQRRRVTLLSVLHDTEPGTEVLRLADLTPRAAHA